MHSHFEKKAWCVSFPRRGNRYTRKSERAWVDGTQWIRTQIKGAQGSVLLRNHSKPMEFIAVARWESLPDWQAFSSAGLPDVGAFRHLAAVSTLVSTEIGEEILDLVEEATPGWI
jgi:hypothetical protein